MLGKYPTPLEDFGGLPVHFTTSSLVTPPLTPKLVAFSTWGQDIWRHFSQHLWEMGETSDHYEVRPWESVTVPTSGLGSSKPIPSPATLFSHLLVKWRLLQGW